MNTLRLSVAGVLYTYADGDVAHGTRKKRRAAAYAAAAPGTQWRVPGRCVTCPRSLLTIVGSALRAAAACPPVHLRMLFTPPRLGGAGDWARSPPHDAAGEHDERVSFRRPSLSGHRRTPHLHLMQTPAPSSRQGTRGTEPPRFQKLDPHSGGRLRTAVQLTRQGLRFDRCVDLTQPGGSARNRSHHPSHARPIARTCRSSPRPTDTRRQSDRIHQLAGYQFQDERDRSQALRSKP